jgi:predicted Zn finger-like uncharacterized protein
MPMTITCSSCSAPLRVREDLVGRLVKCPKCGATMTVPGEEALQPAPAPARPRQAAAPPPADLDEKDDAPLPQKSKKGLLIGLSLGGAGLLALCCCAGVVGALVRYPSLGGIDPRVSDNNPTVTKENFGRLQPGMTLADIEAILGPGRAATQDDVRAAYKGNLMGNAESMNAQWANAISRGTAYCWKNGPRTILIGFGSSPRQGGKVKALFYSEVTPKHSDYQQNGIP